MTARNLSSAMQKSHIRSCKWFAAFLQRSPDTATADDVCAFHQPRTVRKAGGKLTKMLSTKVKQVQAPLMAISPRAAWRRGCCRHCRRF
jgi:hypothetical protein